MLRLYSKGCEYAIRCLLHIKESDCRNGFSLTTICRRAHTPKWFSKKIFQTLSRKGFFTAKRGPGGGYRFKLPPEKVSVLEVIEAVDGKGAFTKCIVRNSSCDSASNCSLHPFWKKLRSALIIEL